MNKLKQWFIGDYLAKTDDVFERSKIELLYNYCVAYFTLGSIFYIGLMVKDLWYHAAVVTFAVISLLSIPFILKYTKNVKKAANLFTFQQILVSCGNIFLQEGKADLSAGFWMSLFILLAFFLYDRKWGVGLILIMGIISGVSGALSQLIKIPGNRPLESTPDVIIFPVLLIIIVVWMFIKSRSDAENYIRKQGKMLEESKKELEIKNKDVTDSINYAQKIQKAVLPHEETIYRSVPLAFILFKPKDIVSGDYFWFHEIDKDNYIMVCGDCTGHGVPGAFMTVIGSNLFNQTVIDNKIYSPSKILLEVDRLLNSTLKQDSEKLHGVQDGMDLSLFKVNKASKEITITSAKRPVVFIRDKQLQDIKPSKFSLGGMNSGDKVFDEIKINYKEDDMFYFFTDGFVDQFGGEKGKKYSSKRLKEKFMEIHLSTIQDQKQMLSQ